MVVSAPVGDVLIKIVAQFSGASDTVMSFESTLPRGEVHRVFVLLFARGVVESGRARQVGDRRVRREGES